MRIEIKNAGLVWWVVDRYYPLLPQWCLEKQIHEDLEQEVYLIALESRDMQDKKSILRYAQKRIYQFIKTNFFLKKRGRSWFRWAEEVEDDSLCIRN